MLIFYRMPNEGIEIFSKFLFNLSNHVKLVFVEDFDLDVADDFFHYNLSTLIVQNHKIGCYCYKLHDNLERNLETVPLSVHYLTNGQV